MSHAIDLPQSLYNRLNKLSEGTRSTPASIAKKAIQAHLDYEEWLLAEVDAGLADVEAGRVLSHGDFWKEIESAGRGKKPKD
jgi:predicted transcriptional regulator